MGSKIGTCPKCKETKELTRHHIFAKRWWKNNHETKLICRACHSQFEYVLNFFERLNPTKRTKQLPKYMYRKLYNMFIEASNI